MYLHYVDTQKICCMNDKRVRQDESDEDVTLLDKMRFLRSIVILNAT